MATILRTLANFVYSRIAHRSAKRPPETPPLSGQSAPFRALPLDRLNVKERTVVLYLDGALYTQRPERTLQDMADACFPQETPDRGNSWVRNSLRRPVSSGWVVRTDRGRYCLSDAGRRRLQERHAA